MTPSSPATETAKRTRSIVLVCGDKGGVGKSTLARTLFEYYQHHKIAVHAFEGDNVNPTFIRFFRNAERLNSRTPKGYEPLINNLDSEKLVQMVDMGGGTAPDFLSFVNQTAFFEAAKECGAQVTILFVLAGNVDSLGLLQKFGEAIGGEARWVIARSQAIPGRWDLWEQSKTRERLTKDFNAVEVDFPMLDLDAYAAVDMKSLSWGTASNSPEIDRVLRRYIYTWVLGMFKRFDTIRDRLI